MHVDDPRLSGGIHNVDLWIAVTIGGKNDLRPVVELARKLVVWNPFTLANSR